MTERKSITISNRFECVRASAKVHLVNVFLFSIESSVKMSFVFASMIWLFFFFPHFWKGWSRRSHSDVETFGHRYHQNTVFLVNKSAFINNSTDATISNDCLCVRLFWTNAGYSSGPFEVHYLNWMWFWVYFKPQQSDELNLKRHF